MGVSDMARGTGDSNESRSSSSKHSSASASVSNSPQISRDPSPIRLIQKTGSVTLSRSSISAPRSRKNSCQDQSPSRPSRPSVPSSAAIQRSLSSGTTPTLLPAAQDQTNAKPPQKSPLQVEQISTPRWPISPRLRSPPPFQQGKSNFVPPAKQQDIPPSINVQRATPSPQLETVNLVSDSETDDSQPQSGMRTPARGTGASTLETVQEVSLPNSPRHGIGSALDQVTESLLSEAAARGDYVEASVTRSKRPSLAATPNESGSENGGNSSRRSGSVAPPPLLSRQSSSNTVKLNGGKGKGSEGSVQQMTVETETVTSVPQVSLAPTPSTQGSQASLRTKPSTETIRPKKEKKDKKRPRKQTTVPAGTASSKADIFEAKIASAIDETNTSDSDETFVYDSNPPDTDRRKPRWHSRTPSATSMISQADRAGMRSIHAVMDASGPSMSTVKKGMKFVNTFSNNIGDPSTGEEDGHGTGRSATSVLRGTGRHAHVNNWRRNNNNTHASLIFDNENGHPSLARQFLHGSASRNSSAGPPSPRPDVRRAARAKRSMQMISSIDLDDSSRADDERMPLLNASIRSSASRRSQARRYPTRHLESQTYHPNPSILTRFANCLVLAIMVILVVTGAIGFMFATSQPLTDVELMAITQVITSEQELMLDMTVRAQNPNVVVVSIEHADIEVFAKSRHAGTDSGWWKHPLGPPKPGSFATRRHQDDEVEALDDPIEDPPQDDSSPNMRLGAITKFDSPLSFEGSFFHGGRYNSTGSVRLARPGNSTAGGTERWERILEDEFSLILKGVLKYSLPLSQRIRSVAITGKTLVKPNSASDPTPRPNGTDFNANA